MLTAVHICVSPSTHLTGLRYLLENVGGVMELRETQANRRIVSSNVPMAYPQIVILLLPLAWFVYLRLARFRS